MINPLGLFVQMFQFAHVLYPGLLACCGLRGQLILHRFRHKLPQGDPALGRCRLSAAKNGVRDLQRRLHTSMIPYLWEHGNKTGEDIPIRLDHGDRP